MFATSHALASIGAVVSSRSETDGNSEPRAVAVAQVPLELISAPPQARAVRYDVDDLPLHTRFLFLALESSSLVALSGSTGADVVTAP